MIYSLFTSPLVVMRRIVVSSCLCVFLFLSLINKQIRMMIIVKQRKERCTLQRNQHETSINNLISMQFFDFLTRLFTQTFLKSTLQLWIFRANWICHRR